MQLEKRIIKKQSFFITDDIFCEGKVFLFPFLSLHHKINSSKHPSFLSRHLFHCLIKSSDKDSPLWRRWPSPGFIFINTHQVASFLLISCFHSLWQKRSRNYQPTGLCVASTCHHIGSWHLCLTTTQCEKTNQLWFVYFLQFVTMHAAKNKKERKQQTCCALHPNAKWLVLGIFISMLQMRNAASHISFKRFVYILLLCNSMAIAAIGKSVGLLHKIVLLGR